MIPRFGLVCLLLISCAGIAGQPQTQPTNDKSKQASPTAAPTPAAKTAAAGSATTAPEVAQGKPIQPRVLSPQWVNPKKKAVTRGEGACCTFRLSHAGSSMGPVTVVFLDADGIVLARADVKTDEIVALPLEPGRYEIRVTPENGKKFARFVEVNAMHTSFELSGRP